VPGSVGAVPAARSGDRAAAVRHATAGHLQGQRLAGARHSGCRLDPQSLRASGSDTLPLQLGRSTMSVGFYGKLPSHGDFISRAVGDQFVDRWDAWLQAGVAQSRADLGEGWLDLFLTSPVWRFALARGGIGGRAFAGVLLPSGDRVGRYFPLTIVADFPPSSDPHVLSVAAAGWFDWVEAIARRALERDLLDLEMLLSELRASEPMLAPERLSEAPVAVAASGFPG